MKLSAPKKINWIVGSILAVLAVLIKFTGLASADAAFWLAFASAALMLVTTFFSGV